ncbi:LLM class flavin-dependent oxidoreductase [Actinoallomurus liliacearum]|uniref:LLM class flavin-dependent oxidoreductase n=1 Tax=Actinoallomurus liliacearum TaxID=1080073 RepID=UPI0031EAE331
MTLPARLGVLVLPEHTGPDGVQVWKRVERLGAHHAWTYDHLSWRSLRGRPWFDAMTTLAAAASVTERIGLGTLVSSPNFRNPVTTAIQAMTIDHISGGRFVFGIGSGAAGSDVTALGGPMLSPEERADRFTEFVTLTDQVLRHGKAEFRGRYFTARETSVTPGCVQRPRMPFAIAGTGRRGMRLAAEFGEIWVTIGATEHPGVQPEADAFRTLRSQLGRLAAACEEVGRDPADLRKLVNLSRIVADPYSSVDRLGDLVGRCACLGFTDVVVAYPRSEGVFAGDAAMFEKAMSAHADG